MECENKQTHKQICSYSSCAHTPHYKTGNIQAIEVPHIHNLGIWHIVVTFMAWPLKTTRLISTGRNLEPVWTWWWREKFLPMSGFKPQPHKPTVTSLTGLYWLFQ